jgi:hypothetical protein
LQPKYSYSPFVAAISWSVLEYFRFEFLNFNPFNYFAYTQSSFNIIAQYASYGGIFLVSFISVLIASYLLKIYLDPNWKKAVPLLIIFIILIIFPLVIPGAISTAIYGFVWSWNDLLYSLTLITSADKRTLAPGLVLTYLGEFQSSWTEMMAASIWVSIPVILQFNRNSWTLVSNFRLSSLDSEW